MKKGYCKNCKGQRVAIKKPFSFFWLIMTGFVYAFYRLIFIRRNKCNVCYNKLK